MTYPDFQNGHQHVIRVTHKARRTGWDGFPPEIRDAKLAQADEQFEADLQELARRTAEQQARHRSAVMRWSGVGLLLIGLGSALQGAALLVVQQNVEVYPAMRLVAVRVL